VLLDENLDHHLRKMLGPHDVATTSYMGWSGLKNGELLRAAEEAGFDVLLTGDRGIPHQQNPSGRRLAIVCLSSIRLSLIERHLPRVIAAIEGAIPGTVVSIDVVA
jgi:hypothetical protein